MLRIALAQINTTVGDLSGNSAQILAFAEKAKLKGADIVAFPELAVCGYPPEDLLLKEHFIRDNIKTLNALAKQIDGICAVVGFVDADKNKKIYNAAAVIAQRKVVGVYHKESLPNYGVFDEKRYFEAGSGNKIFSINGHLVGINICEDIWIPKGVCQRQAKEGAQVIINISSSPFDFEKLEERVKIVKSRSKECKASVCYVNLVGGQDELIFDGGSFVMNPKGTSIASGKTLEEDLIVADLPLVPSKKKISLTKVVVVKREAQIVIKAKVTPRLEKSLNSLERIYKALVLGTHDYVRKNGFEKVLIGLSGGIDSSLVAAIAVDAIGKENVVGVTMPSRFTSDGTRNDAIVLAKNLGIKLIEIPIEKVVGAYTESLRDVFQGVKPDLTEENLQARIRGNFLMALSNKFGWLVLTTGNKSEVAVGYCTLYGDMSGGFAIIKDVLKMQVYELSRFRNTLDKKIIPESVFDRAPTAELRANQTDQDSLPPYAVLDDLLKGYVENHSSASILSKKHSAEIVHKVVRMVDRNEYKRRQAPPGIKITSRAFGKDWRLPITNKYKEF